MYFLLSHDYSTRYKKVHLKDLIFGTNDIPLNTKWMSDKKTKDKMKHKLGEEKEESEKVIKQWNQQMTAAKPLWWQLTGIFWISLDRPLTKMPGYQQQTVQPDVAVYSSLKRS